MALCQPGPIDRDVEEATQHNPGHSNTSPHPFSLSPLSTSSTYLDSLRDTSNDISPLASPLGHLIPSSLYYTSDGTSIHSAPLTEYAPAGLYEQFVCYSGSVDSDLAEVCISIRHMYPPYTSIAHYPRQHDFVGCEPDNSGEQPDCRSCHTPSPDLSRDVCRYPQEEKAPFR